MKNGEGDDFNSFEADAIDVNSSAMLLHAVCILFLEDFTRLSPRRAETGIMEAFLLALISLCNLSTNSS